jgi:hypothetical protein
MVLVLKKGATRQQIAALEKKLYGGKAASGFDAKKYNGVLKQLKQDPLTIQKQLRDEWERDFS